MLDFLVKNAEVIDGTGAPPFKADVGVKDGMIAAVAGSIPANSAGKVVDARGLSLCPGFIDSHGHSDISILAAPEALGKISQGITTEITGNCGLSVFPVTDLNREHLQCLYSRYGVKIDWSDIGAYGRKLGRVRPTINIASLCGHNTLRAAVAGYARKSLGRKELLKMLSLLSANLEAGAAGLSTGFLYVPGKFADEKEKEALFNILAKSGKPYATHLESEGKLLVESLEQCFRRALRTGLKKVHISHLKTSGRANWHKLPDALELFAKFAGKGLSLSADRYPFTESMTSLGAFLPEPYSSFGDDRLMEMMGDEKTFEKFKTELAAAGEKYWSNKRLVSTDSAGHAKFCGERLPEIGRRLGLPASAVVAELIRADSPGTFISSAGMSRINMRRIISRPFVCCGTDETAKPADHSLGVSHPRGFASFPLFINLLLYSMKVEKIVRKVTSLTAAIFGLEKRGCVRQGFHADMVLVDFDCLGSRADFKDSHRLADGIVKVWVNGKLAYDGLGKTVVGRNGRFIANIQ